MNKGVTLQTLQFGVPLVILLFLALLPSTIAFQRAPSEISLGILLDLLISIPLVYSVLGRKTTIPSFTVLYVLLIGIVAAGFILPADQQYVLSRAKVMLIPMVEMGILSVLVYKIISLKKSFKHTNGADFYDRLLHACKEVLPNRVGKVLATEVAVMYYLFAPTRKRTIQENEFTYFRKSGIKPIIGAFLFMLLFETLIVHVLVERWNPSVAWILTCIGVYTMLQIWAILRSMNQRLIVIDDETRSLILRYGFGCQTAISFDKIQAIHKGRKAPSQDKQHVSLSLFELVDASNVTIQLAQEHTLHKVYGMKKKYTSISLFVDEIDLFMDKIKAILIQNESSS